MDPASLALACAGIAGLATAAKRMSKTMLKVYRDGDGIRSDIHVSIRRLRVTTDTINLAVKSLFDTIGEDPGSEVALYLKNQQVLASIGDEAELLSKTMDRLTQKISSTVYFREAKWVWNMKKKVDALTPFSSHVHLLLQSVTTSLLLERSKTGPPPSEASWQKTADAILRYFESRAQQIIASLKQIADYELKPAAEVLWKAQQSHNITSAISKVLALAEQLQSTGTVPGGNQSNLSPVTSASLGAQSLVSHTTGTDVRPSTASFLVQNGTQTRHTQQRPSGGTSHAGVQELVMTAGGKSSELVFQRSRSDSTLWELASQAHGSFFYLMISMDTSWDDMKRAKCQGWTHFGRNLISPEEARRLGLEVQHSDPRRVRIGGHGPFIKVGVITDVVVRPSVSSELVFALDFIVCEGLECVIIGRALRLAST